MRTVAVPFWGHSNKLPVDPFDEQVQYTFTNGQCHSFALALHEQTGWPLRVLCYEYDGYADDENYYISEQGDHVVVERPDGMYVDVFGAWAPGTRWAHLPVAMPIEADEVERVLGEWDEVDPKAARPFAKALLNTKVDGVTILAGALLPA